jgi:hypothetical protein
MDQNAMNFVLFRMKQYSAALAAGVVYGIIFRPKYGRSVQDDTSRRGIDYFEADPTSGHNVLPLYS